MAKRGDVWGGLEDKLRAKCVICGAPCKMRVPYSLCPKCRAIVMKWEKVKQRVPRYRTLEEQIMELWRSRGMEVQEIRVEPSDDLTIWRVAARPGKNRFL